MLNSVEWKYFKLDDLFEIKRGGQNYISKMNSGTYPYVSATEKNNGVSGFVDKYTNEGGVITLSYDGSIGEVFYQPKKFCSSEKIAILSLKENKKLTPELALFFVTVLKKEKYRYGYGRKWSIQSRLKPTIIKLPVDSDGNPNWEFMEEYMKKISKGNLEGFSLPKNDTRLSLNDREWSEFRLEDLFEFDRGKRFSVNNIKNPNGIYPIITASENMPDTKTIHNEFIVNNKHSIIVNRSGTTGHVRYIKGAFCPTENVYILTAKKDISINEFNSLFITTILQREKFRYMYGRTSSAGRLKNTIIKLPIKPKSFPDEKSEPDWEFMESYIKGLPYTNKL